MTSATAAEAAVARGERAAEATLRELSRALALIEGSDDARALRTGAPTSVEIESPLAEWLYANWWTGDSGDAIAPERALVAPPAFPRVGLFEAMRRRAAGTSDAWIVLAVGDGTVTVVASRRPSSAPPGHVRIATDRIVSSSRPGSRPAPGDLVTISRGSSGWDRASGWWWAHSGEGVPEGPLDRWYTHSRSPEDSAALLPPLMGAFSDAGSAFSLKCLPAPAGYGRPDALVVYTPRIVRARVAAALRRAATDLAPHVDASIPPTTRRIARGVGMSEDPADGTSFGQLRTAQVAAIAAMTAHTDAAPHRLREAAGAAGLDVTRPWKARS
ncbi:T3SS effector HopA1 family protein [Microbacterium sp. C23T]